jgi:predicted TIM-barrel fold metal-dependent hydrolase
MPLPAARWRFEAASTADCPPPPPAASLRASSAVYCRNAMTIDVWMQHPTPHFLRSDMLASLRRWTGEAIPEDRIPIEATRGAMDEAGVDFGLLSAWRGPNDADLISNDDVAEWVSRHPDRFAALAAVDLDRPMAAVRELRRRVLDDGFVGLRVVPWLWNAAPTDRRYYPLFAECVELDVPFCTQVGHTGPLRPSETGRPIPYVDQVALDFPELVVVCGHVGYPWTEEMVAVARKHENVYIDTSAYTTKRLPEELIRFLKTRTGQRKILFGTNYPMIRHAHALAGLDELDLSEDARRDYLHRNAERVFRLAQRKVPT